MIAVTRLAAIRRSNWKQLLLDVTDLVLRFDAKTLVIGFPLSLDGSEGTAAQAARALAHKFACSLKLPVYLQDERLSSREARENLHAEGVRREAMSEYEDSEAAAVILRDFLAGGQHRTAIKRPFI
jgi:putative holliday junction resolvase